MALAVGEAAAKVIQHAYQNRADAKLALEIHELPGRMEFFLEDSAPKKRSQTVRPQPPDETQKGGAGVHLFQEVMDSTVYDTEFSGGNRLKMTKLLSRKVPSDVETAN
jgi:anti-sigma regulatory factor (Ser/Thr protein kinase)